MLKGRNSATSSSSSSSGHGSQSSSSSSLVSLGSQSTLIDAKSPVSKHSSYSLKEEHACDEDESPPTNQTQDQVRLTNRNKDVVPSVDNVFVPIQRTENVDYNSNNDSQNGNSFPALEKNIRSTRASKKSVNLVDSCQDCVNQQSINHSPSDNESHPRFTKEMVDSTAFPGDIVRFDTEFSQPSSVVTVTWYYEDEEILEDHRHSVVKTSSGSSLIIREICEDDDGEYSCKISNSCGETMCSAELVVYGAL